MNLLKTYDWNPKRAEDYFVKIINAEVPNVF